MAEIECSLHKKLKAAVDRRRSHSPPPRRHSDAHSHHSHSSHSHSREPPTHVEAKATLHRVDSATSIHQSPESLPPDLIGRSRLLSKKLDLLVAEVRKKCPRKNEYDQATWKTVVNHWAVEFYALVRPRQNPTMYLMDDRDFDKILVKLKELQEYHAKDLVSIHRYFLLTVSRAESMDSSFTTAGRVTASRKDTKLRPSSLRFT
jgi:hypothetical protein